MTAEHAAPPGGAVAVCICTAGRPGPLGRLLDQLAAIDTAEVSPSALALIVVDNRPSPATRAVVERAAARVGFRLAYVAEAQPGIPHARNRAVASALAGGADLVAFVDDDDLPAPDWLDELVRTQRRTGAGMVFGRTRHAPGTRLPAWLAEVDQFQPSLCDTLNEFGLPQAAGTNNVLLSRCLLETIGRDGPVFRTELTRCGGEDTDLFIRAKAAGFAFAVAERSEVVLCWEAERLTLPGTLRRAYNKGVLRHHLRRLHRGPRPRPGWRASRKLGKTMSATLGAVLRLRPFIPGLVKAAEDLGEVAATFGVEAGAYYARRTSNSASTTAG